MARARTQLKPLRGTADSVPVGRSVIGLCAGFGGFVGSEVPALWGGSGFSVTSVLLGLVGGCAGIWLGLRLSDA